MKRTTLRRRSRRPSKSIVCWGCRRPIEAGQSYLEHVMSPTDEDNSWVHAETRRPIWMRSIECAKCAVDLGRGHLLQRHRELAGAETLAAAYGGNL